MIEAAAFTATAASATEVIVHFFCHQHVHCNWGLILSSALQLLKQLKSAESALNLLRQPQTLEAQSQTSCCLLWPLL